MRYVRLLATIISILIIFASVGIGIRLEKNQEGDLGAMMYLLGVFLILYNVLMAMYRHGYRRGGSLHSDINFLKRIHW
ncbi:MAG: hypothetical protein G01um101470_640 [Parcubacteria group bacterium Gr01-1014_70]|nr:MAG: hypothetical protein G01um101470_640 [Parcubacteria group bacterium Gr01-1014_70]